jgi:DNA invertase Pin-like site-specific DNA recombinase
MNKDRRKGIQYSRKSTKPKGIFDEKESVQYQEKVMDEYSQHHNIEIVARFSDIGYSGVHSQRPELIEMLEFLENTEEKVDVLLFYTVDRLGRDLRNNVDLVLKISDLVDEVVFVSEGITNSYDYFKMFLIQKSIIAEEERINILERLLEGRRVKVKFQKTFVGPRKPLGYVQKRDGTLKLATFEQTRDLEEIQGLEVVNYIFLAYLSNQSISQIAKDLNQKFGLTCLGKKWDKNSVAYILRNDIYAGILSGKIKGEEYEVSSDRVEPLLSKITYQFIQTKLNNAVKGRQPKRSALPQLSICIHCLKPIIQNGLEINCPNCHRIMDVDFYSTSVEKWLTRYLLREYSNDVVDKYLKNKRSNFFFRISKLQENVKELEGRRLLIESFFYDDPQILKLLLYYNTKEIRKLEREINETQQFLQFLYEEDKLLLTEVIRNQRGNDLYIHLPYLLLVDFFKQEIYLKFHPCIFEENSEYEGII